MEPSALKQQIERKKVARGKFGHVSGAEPGAKTLVPTEDVRRIEGQNFFVFSYITADGSTRVRSPDGLRFKFSGALATEKQAWEHAEAIRNEDPRFDVFVADLYKWGRVPMAESEKPFVKRIYSDEIMTKMVSGLQTTMVQGRKEVEDRRAKARLKAEDAMKEKMGPEYKAPEKSKELLDYEEDVRKERIAQDELAREQGKCSGHSYLEKDISEIATEYFLEHEGETIGVGSAADFMKNLIKKSIEKQAALLRATKSERAGDLPPTSADVDRLVAERDAAPAKKDAEGSSSDPPAQ